MQYSQHSAAYQNNCSEFTYRDVTGNFIEVCADISLSTHMVYGLSSCYFQVEGILNATNV